MHICVMKPAKITFSMPRRLKLRFEIGADECVRILFNDHGLAVTRRDVADDLSDRCVDIVRGAGHPHYA